MNANLTNSKKSSGSRKGSNRDHKEDTRSGCKNGKGEDPTAPSSAGRDGEKGSQFPDDQGEHRSRRDRKNRRNVAHRGSGPRCSKTGNRKMAGSTTDTTDVSDNERDRSRSRGRAAKGKRQQDPPMDHDTFEEDSDVEVNVDSLDEETPIASPVGPSDREEETESIEDDEEETAPNTSEKLSPDQVEYAGAMLKEVREKVIQLVGEENCPNFALDWKKGERGRPPKTGEYYAKRMENAAKSMFTAAQELRIMRDATIPADLSKNRKIEEKKIEEELEHTPTATLPGIILEEINRVDLVNEKSGNLKGEFKGFLNKSAAKIKVALTKYVERHQVPESEHERDVEMERMREKISNQEREIERLRRLEEHYESMQQEVRILQAQMEEQRRMPQEQNPYERGAKRRKPMPQIEASSSDKEEEVEIAPLPQRRAKTGPPVGKEKEKPTDMEVDETEEEAEDETVCTFDEVREEIARTGMPAAVRPAIQGQRKIIDPEVPAKSETSKEPPSNNEGSSMEERLARMLVKCVDDKVRGIEDNIVKRLAPQMTKRKGEETRTPPETFLSNEESTLNIPRKSGRTGGKKISLARREATKGTVSQIKGGSEEQVVAPKTRTEKGGTPANSQATEPQWSQIVGRKAGQTKNKGKGGTAKSEPSGKKDKTPQQQQQKVLRRKVPKTAAVTLTCPKETYAECMGLVREKIKLRDLGIEKPLNVRKTATGALSLEVSGQENAAKADALAAKMSEVLTGKEGVRVARPSLTAELRISNFEESVGEEEIRATLAEISHIPPSSVTIGQVRKAPNGLCTIFVKCPVAAANTLAGGRRVMLGWANARVELLEKRPLQCYRCQETGHTRATCRSEVDRTGACYRCGQVGHQARNCTAPFRCDVCAIKGLPSGHRVGGKSCSNGKKTQKRTPPKKEINKTVVKVAVAQKEETEAKDQKPGTSKTTKGKTKPKIVGDEIVIDLNMKKAGCKTGHPGFPKDTEPMEVEKEGEGERMDFSKNVQAAEQLMDVEEAVGTAKPRRVKREDSAGKK